MIELQNKSSRAFVMMSYAFFWPLIYSNFANRLSLGAGV